MFDRKLFFTAVRATFGSLVTGQVEGFEAILAEWERRGLTDVRWLAYMLATTWHETGKKMQPVREGGRGAGHKYGVPVNGKVYYGRGFVQLTWDYNYRKAGEKLGVDLIGNPDKALDPAIAAAIMFQGMIEGWFTGKKLATYFPPGASDSDPVGARRIINGTDRAADIAGYHSHFLAALRRALLPGTGPVAKPAPKPVPVPAAPKPVPAAPAESRWSKVGTFMSSLFRKAA